MAAELHPLAQYPLLGHLAVIVIPRSEALKCSGIMAHQDGVHTLNDGPLPCVVLAHAMGGALLPNSDAFSVHAVDALPGAPGVSWCPGKRASNELSA
jgi:hypothetical protein